MSLFRRHRAVPLPDDWEDVVARRWAGWWDRPLAQRERIRDLATHLVGTKRWEAARGFALTDEVRLVVAVQAALPVAALPDPPYPNVGSIVIHRTHLVDRSERPGPVAGLVTDEPLALAGEAAHEGGPVVLAWDEVVADARHPRRGRNVVIHEFAHKLDMLDHVVDGTPPLATAEQGRRWVEVCSALYRSMVDGTPSPVLDDYAATGPGEFFAVASEAFFTVGDDLRTHHPDLYGVLADFYRQDPAAG